MARHRNPVSRFSCRFASLSLTVVMAILFGCGGGTEVAPPTPLVEGDGFGQATLDGVSRGETEVVSSLVSGATTRTVTVAGEAAQFAATGYLTAANRPLTLSPVTLTGPGGTYSQGPDEASCIVDPTCQFWVEDYGAGALGRNPSATTPIPTGVPLSLGYEWTETLQSIEVSLSFGTIGEDIRISVHNVGASETGPFTVTVSASAAPSDGSKAFDATMRTGLLQPTGQKVLRVVADPGNRLEVTGVDLSNPLNPCIQGRLTSAMTDSLAPDPANPNYLDATFDDSLC